MPLNTSLCHHSDKSMRQAKFQDFPKGTLKFHFFQISLFSIRFLENVERGLPQKGTGDFLFSSVKGRPKFTTGSVKEMRKKVQKERCTKIMLTKCKAVCCLYDKVQLAAAKMLDAEPAIFQFECNVPILCNDIPANDLNLPSETYTTDFVLHYDDGHTAVREAVFRSYLSRPSVAEKLELSRRYWQQQGISDWGIIIDKEDTSHEES